MGEEDLVVGQQRDRRATLRRGLLLIASVMLLAACSSDASKPAGSSATATTHPPGQPVGASGAECRNALAVVDAYLLARQAGGANDADVAAARSRCLAASEVPPSCSDAMRISVAIAELSLDNPEFVSSYTAYGEASTLCRLKLLKSI